MKQTHRPVERLLPTWKPALGNQLLDESILIWKARCLLLDRVYGARVRLASAAVEYYDERAANSILTF
jgi:hypothetical protein